MSGMEQLQSGHTEAQTLAISMLLLPNFGRYQRVFIDQPACSSIPEFDPIPDASY
jgi:hypothetical protein